MRVHFIALIADVTPRRKFKKKLISVLHYSNYVVAMGPLINLICELVFWHNFRFYSNFSYAEIELMLHTACYD